MNLLAYRAFVTELVKIALELQDSDVRKLMADRAGKEYLEGGELPTNFRGQGADRGYVPELQKKASQTGLGSMDPTTTPLDRLRSKVKSPGAYQNARDTAMTGLGGALTGGAVVRGVQAFRKYDPTGANYFSPKTYMAAAAVGAGAGLADRLYRHRHELKFGKQEPPQPQPQTKVANLSSATFSPGRELDRGHKVGHFQNKVHMGTPAPAAGLMGKDGRMPTPQ